MSNKRLVIAGVKSGVGKTTIALGLMAALNKKGYRVQPFKVGPDYIDPGFHTLVTGNISYNLDNYFLGDKGVKEIFNYNTTESDIAIIEGVMGLFDGKGKKGASSTAEIAKILKAPVILIIDSKKMAQSGAALAYGYKNYDSKLNVKGVILNNIASERHYKLIKNAVENEPVNLPVIGYIPRQKRLKLPERHLGLVPTHESKELNIFIENLVNIIEKHINLDKLIKLASGYSKLESDIKKLYSQRKEYDVKIAIAYDKAFNFYYQYNLDLLEMLGAELIYFSPVQDNSLPDVDGIYLGGGFPEIFLEQLSSNNDIKQKLKEKISSGMPVYAECGGLMYLSKEIKDVQGNIYPMVNIIPAQTEMKDSLREMGYVEVETVNSNILMDIGEKARGHVFHYSRLNKLPAGVKHCYQLADNKFEGYSLQNNVLLSYVHLHFASNPVIAHNFLHQAELYNKHNY